MSEYACNECCDGSPDGCRAISNKKPIYCLYSGTSFARWFEIKDGTQSMPEQKKEESCWCKVGAHCWSPFDGYGVIAGFAPNGIYVKFFKNKEESGCIEEDLFEAKYEPWVRKEWESAIGQRFRLREGLFILLGVADHDDGFYLDFSNCSGTPQCLEKEENSLRQIDGSPCGTISHKSEDGKSWVVG